MATIGNLDALTLGSTAAMLLEMLEEQCRVAVYSQTADSPVQEIEALRLAVSAAQKPANELIAAGLRPRNG